MKYLQRVVVMFVLFVVLPATYGAGQNVTVEIDYGGLQQNRKVDIKWKQGITALDALQSAAQTETRLIGERLLVTSIDGVEGQVGIKVWYYRINDKSATLFADKCILNEDDCMRWTYTKDICSPGRGE
ncbi:MAG: DUF4430 domain-containing protein [Planctomycetes bacterium]|nr:DUF4430 domain-containing protein [Planctomycetota bacterium]